MKYYTQGVPKEVDHFKFKLAITYCTNLTINFEGRLHAHGKLTGLFDWSCRTKEYLPHTIYLS